MEGEVESSVRYRVFMEGIAIKIKARDGRIVHPLSVASSSNINLLKSRVLQIEKIK